MNSNSSLVVLLHELSANYNILMRAITVRFQSVLINGTKTGSFKKEEDSGKGKHQFGMTMIALIWTLWMF